MNESQIKQLVQQELKNILFSRQRERGPDKRLSAKAAERNNNETTTLQSVVIQNIAETTKQEPLKFNYLTEGTYKGETKKFALTGAVVSAEAEAELTGEILTENFIEFGGCNELTIYSKSVGEAPNISYEVWIHKGAVNGLYPPYFNNGDFSVFNGSGFGVVWLKIILNEGGYITGSEIGYSQSTNTAPSNTNTNFYYLLGSYNYAQDGTVTVYNPSCGNLDAIPCRSWFALTAPYYTVHFIR
jgi:hypothetical protein